MAGSQSGGSVNRPPTGSVQHSPPRALQAPLPAAELEVQEFEQADDDTGLEAAGSRTASSVRSQNNAAEAGELQLP